MSTYGAILKVNDMFVNKDTDYFMKYLGFNVPRWITIDKKGTRQDFQDVYYAYIGDNKMYGSWIGIYKTGLTFVEDGKLKREFDVEGLDWNKSPDMVIPSKLKGIEALYLAKLDENSKHPHRFYLSTRSDGKRFECIFGYGITPMKEHWKINKSMRDVFEYSDVEIEEIERWF